MLSGCSTKSVKAKHPSRSTVSPRATGNGAVNIGPACTSVWNSPFSPIVAPSRVPWGEKAFTAYLGDDRDTWKAWDACELVRDAGQRVELLVDQGDADEFLEEQLRPELLREACGAAGHPLRLRMQPGYDHSYYFIASFIGEHLAHHSRALKG